MPQTEHILGVDTGNAVLCEAAQVLLQIEELGGLQTKMRQPEWLFRQFLLIKDRPRTQRIVGNTRFTWSHVRKESF